MEKIRYTTAFCVRGKRKTGGFHFVNIPVWFVFWCWSQTSGFLTYLTPTSAVVQASREKSKSLEGDDAQKGIPRLDASKVRPALPFSPRWQGENLFLSFPTVTCVFTQSEKKITALSQSHPPRVGTWNKPRRLSFPTPTAQEKPFHARKPPTFKLDRSFFRSLKWGWRCKPAWAKETRARAPRSPPEDSPARRDTGRGWGGWGGKTGGSGTTLKTLK